MLSKTKSTGERVQVVLDIAKRLKRFPKSDMSGYIDLYNSPFSAMIEIKKIFKEYIDSGIGASGKIYFHELDREIVYNLPASINKPPLFVLRARSTRAYG